MDVLSLIKQFKRLYSSEEECIALAYKLKWPSGFQCPYCNHCSAYIIRSRRLPLYECHKCRHQTSLTSNTVMDKSRTPLRKWLLTMYIISTSDTSINAVSLAKRIDVTYKTAWSMLKKLRQAISDLDRGILLSGAVEAKLEVYMKQPIPTYEALQREHAAIIARTVTSTNCSYFKIKLLPAQKHPRGLLTNHAEKQFIKDHVSIDYTHLEINRRFVHPPRCQAILPGIARSAFEWMNETFHGIGLAYSQFYLDEFCFRQNHKAKLSTCPFEYLLGLTLSNATKPLAAA